jgi:hypothetical protein
MTGNLVSGLSGFPISTEDQQPMLIYLHSYR